MGGGGAPAAPNPYQVGQAQAQQNVDTGVANAWLGNTNQVTPYGNLTYTQTGTQSVGGRDVPTFTATQTLSPEQQAIYNKTTGLQTSALDTAKNVLGQVDNSVNTPLSFDNAPAMPTDQTALRNDAYRALTARSTEDLNSAEDRQRTQLANQGIAAGTTAYDRALQPIDRARVDASNQATINAGNIAGQNLSQAQALRNQSINETQTLRNQPLQDYATLAGFGGGVQQPNYAPATQATIAPTDITSPVYNSYNGQLQAYQQQQGAQNSLMGGLFGLGGSILGGAARNPALFMGSDVRIKENIKRIATASNGLGIYAYNHIGDPLPRIGLLAQEVEQIHPEAVMEIDGVKHVNYDAALR